MKAKLKVAILKSVLACDGNPMPESALVSAAQILVRPASATMAEVLDALKDCEGEMYVSGNTDDFTGERSWTLTEKGTHKARQLR